VIQLMQEAIESPEHFDPSTSRRSFSFIATDFGAAFLMPKLLQHLRDVAPGVRVRAIAAPRHGVEDMLEAGEGDLAIGSFAINRAPFFQRRLYGSDYVCLVRAGHPLADVPLTEEAYLNASHALVTPLPLGYEALERFLLDNIRSSLVAAMLPSYLSVLTTLPGSDALFTLSRRAGMEMARLAGARVLELPVRIPGFVVRQFWHERFHKDPASKWFRDVVYSLLMEDPDARDDT
jgi:DNA-binding transcriptional LysR family regulator